MSASYHFLPWVRQGAATAIRIEDRPGASLAGRASLPVTLRVNERREVKVQLRFYGPGDVVGIDPRQVIRREPAPRSTQFEPNYFPAIEFDRPDFPWLFTPAAAADQGRLRPWVCLVVVRQQPGVSLAAKPDRPLPILRIQPPAHPEHELPDLAESWAWAHAQVVAREDGQELSDLLAGRPAQNLSRLLCPRRLAPDTGYYACLVPAFEAGRRAALGLEVAEDHTLEPAWDLANGADDPIELPVYDQWEFSTGAAGDFEALVQRLEQRPLPPGVGAREMQVAGLGFQLPNLGSLDLAGALRPPKKTRGQPEEEALADISGDFQAGLAEILNLPARLAEGTVGPEPEPIVTPPIYGRWHTAQSTVPGEDRPPHWVRELNLDPRRRAAAGLGTLVIQDQQEQLMASAWEQLAASDQDGEGERSADRPPALEPVGGIRQANQVLRQAQLAREASGAIHRKRFSRMPPDLLLQLTGPIQARVRMSPQTLRHQLRQSRLPEAATSTPFRRIFRPRSSIRRREFLLRDQPSPSRSLVGRLAAGEITAAPPSRTQEAIDAPQDAPPLGELRELLAAETDQGRFPSTDVFRETAGAQLAYVEETKQVTEPEAKPSLAPAEIQPVLLQRLDPEETVAARVLSRLQRAADGPTSQDPLDPIMAAPEFPRPMYEALADLSQEWLLPGLEEVPDNTVTLLQTNPQFVEAYMVGLNHEMSRELLWREYPTDQRGTYFRRFWDGPAEGQLPPIHQWAAEARLGDNAAGDDQDGKLVLLIRGELLRRYPNTIIYAVEAAARHELGTTEKYPLFSGSLEPDVTFLGFDLSAAEARGADGQPGWFFVIQQQPTEPRFGLDATSEQASPGQWDDLAWPHVATSSSGHVKVLDAPAALPEISDPRGRWGVNAAHMAAITLQRPFRIAVHANDLLPLTEET